MYCGIPASLECDLGTDTAGGPVSKRKFGNTADKTQCLDHEAWPSLKERGNGRVGEMTFIPKGVGKWGNLRIGLEGIRKSGFVRLGPEGVREQRFC